MRRIIRLVRRLYPSSWRKRYGEEFDALLEDSAPSGRDAFDVFWGALKMQVKTWSFGRIMLAFSVAGIVVAGAVSSALPSHYQSQSLLMVTPADGAARLLINLQRSVVSQESLSSIIQKYNLYPRERASMPLDDVIEKMRKSIILQPMRPGSAWDQDTLAFRIVFDYSDPHLAQQVNADLVSRFMEGNLKNAQDLKSHSNLETLDPPSLSRTPAGPKRTQLVVVGMFAGLLAGLTLVIVFRLRRSKTSGSA